MTIVEAATASGRSARTPWTRGDITSRTVAAGMSPRLKPRYSLEGFGSIDS